MADLYVLEGRDGMTPRSNHPIRSRKCAPRSRVVPGIVYGNPLALLGALNVNMSAIQKKQFEAQIKAKEKQGVVFTEAEKRNKYSPTTLKKLGYTKSKGNILERTAKGVADAGSTVVRATQSNVLRPAAGAVATGTRATVRAVGTALDVSRRVAKRAIRAVAKKVLFKGDLLGASAVAAVPKNAAKGILIPAATAAVLANPVTAPVAPAVPVIVNEVIDELYNSISDSIAKGLSPEDAAKKARADLDKLEAGSENDPKPFPVVPVAIGVAVLLGALVVMRNND